MGVSPDPHVILIRCLKYRLVPTFGSAGEKYIIIRVRRVFFGLCFYWIEVRCVKSFESSTLVSEPFLCESSLFDISFGCKFFKG